MGLGAQATQHILLELRGIAGRHSSDNVEVDGVKVVGATNNGRLLGLQLTLGYTF